MNPATTTRLTAAERREEILDAAMVEFSERGLHGTSTEDIAKRAGISQPYLFRLFGTKKELFKATNERCLRQTLGLMQTAAAGLRGEEALQAIGKAYMERLGDQTFLRAQMHAYTACSDPEIREVVKRGYGELVAYAQRVSGADPEHIAGFFAQGMLLNVLASMDVLESDEPWAQTLIEGCRKRLA
ncbi:MAG TPA: helix-turn-helix domain-containing protein [Gaiellaceae bacterium]|jgi:AcrR family transcriptional regulator